MKLNCKHCGQDIRPEDMNPDRLIATCWSCHAIHDISALIEAERQVESQAEPAATSEPIPPSTEDQAPALTKERPTVPMPDGIILQFDGEVQQELSPTYRTAPQQHRELRLIRKWFGPRYLGMLLFACIWNALLVKWYGDFFTGGSEFGGFSLFSLIHVGAGVAITYSAIAGLVNWTVIEVKDSKLTIAHGPLPWMGNKSVAVDELVQLFCVEKIHRSKNGTRYTYTLSAVFRDGGTIALIKKVPDAFQVLYIEQMIEDTLGIVDEQVPGEFHGDESRKTGWL